MNRYPNETVRNPITTQRHRREVFWQITVPLVAGILIILGLAVLTAAATNPAAKSQLADIALINLITPLLIAGLLFLLMLGFTVYGLTMLLGKMPEIFLRIQLFFWRVQSAVGEFDNRLTKPFIRLKGFTASGRAFGRSLHRMRRRR